MSKPAILITGGAQRIGAVLTRHFAALDWHVVIHCHRSLDTAHALAATLPSADVIQCDLADTAAAVTMVSTLAQRLENWRVMANCAAIFELDTASALDQGVFARSMAINAASPVAMAQTYLAQARAKGGRRVVNFLDQKLVNPNPDFFSYTMSKHALAAATTMLAMAQTDPDDRVYGLAPGAMLPSFDQAEQEHQISGRMNLLQRLTEAEELAEAVAFLAEGALASGETLYIDSGQHLLAQPRDVLYLARQ